ncbi:MAG: type VI secretion system tube protein Hcp, partial [Xanthomonadales bacterium]|nr:type VI secretion system tube protein Hcp [Xanthomonadales bacterium]
VHGEQLLPVMPALSANLPALAAGGGSFCVDVPNFLDYASNGIPVLTQEDYEMARIWKAFVVNSITFAMFCTASLASAAIFVKLEGVPGNVAGPDNSGDWFVADSFSFGVEREMKESGEKGGTADINIGVGELQECTISKSMDAAVVSPSAPPVCYAHFVMERCFVKNFSTSGDADDRPTEEVAFYYNKIAFGHAESGRDNAMTWDNVKNRPWPEGLTWLFDFGDR